nr:hypothetical protein [Mycoplasmopsis bovis]
MKQLSDIDTLTESKIKKAISLSKQITRHFLTNSYTDLASYKKCR